MQVSAPKALASALILGLSTSASHAVILAAWDDWADTGSDGTYDADSTFTGFSAQLDAAANRINANWSSTDGTYGNVPGAPTAANGSFLTRQSGSALDLTFTITNNSGSDYNLESFNFDFAPREDGSGSNGPNAFVLTYASGGLEVDGTQIASETDLPVFLTGPYQEDPNSDGNYPDYSYSLSPTLSSIVLANGESATFTLNFSGQSGGNAINVSSMVDNVAFTGAVVPEPAAYAALFGLAAGLIALRRRLRK